MDRVENNGETSSRPDLAGEAGRVTNATMPELLDESRAGPLPPQVISADLDLILPESQPREEFKVIDPRAVDEIVGQEIIAAQEITEFLRKGRELPFHRRWMSLRTASEQLESRKIITRIGMFMIERSSVAHNSIRPDGKRILRQFFVIPTIPLSNIVAWNNHPGIKRTLGFLRSLVGPRAVSVRGVSGKYPNERFRLVYNVLG